MEKAITTTSLTSYTWGVTMDKRHGAERLVIVGAIKIRSPLSRTKEIVGPTHWYVASEVLMVGAENSTLYRLSESAETYEGARAHVAAIMDADAWRQLTSEAGVDATYARLGEALD